MTDLERLRQFARWVIEGGSLDGGDVQDMALRMGLLREEPYDPSKHGPNEVDAGPGDPWYVFTEVLDPQP